MGSSTTLFSAPVLVVVVLMILVGPGRSDIDKDREECTDQLVGIATCLPYVSGGARAPTLECCSGLKQVVQKSTKCLCILIRDRDDPKLGLNINVTLALGLPDSCHIPTNLTRCVDLLHLSSNSTEAKVFEDFGKTVHTKNSTIPVVNGNLSSPAKEDSKSDGGDGKMWVGTVLQAVFIGLCALFFTSSSRVF